jgi:hypothetical protein
LYQKGKKMPKPNRQRKLLPGLIFPLHVLPVRQLQHPIHIFIHQRIVRGHQDGGTFLLRDLAEQGKNLTRCVCIQFAGVTYLPAGVGKGLGAEKS